VDAAVLSVAVWPTRPSRERPLRPTDQAQLCPQGLYETRRPQLQTRTDRERQGGPGPIYQAGVASLEARSGIETAWRNRLIEVRRMTSARLPSQLWLPFHSWRNPVPRFVSP
jgi:hypothetical protein